MAPRQRGLRARMNRLEGKANQTMNAAQGAIYAVKEAALGLLEDLRSGIDITLSKRKGVTWKDFFFGTADEIPFRLQVRFPGDDEESDA